MKYLLMVVIFFLLTACGPTATATPVSGVTATVPATRDAMLTNRLVSSKFSTTGEISQREQMFIRVKEVIVEQLGSDPYSIKLESNFYDDLEADEYDILEFFMALEEDFGIEIPDYKAKEITTVGEVVDYLCAQAEPTKTNTPIPPTNTANATSTPTTKNNSVCKSMCSEIKELELFIRVKEVIVEQLGSDPYSIKLESNFYDDLEADEYNILEFFMALEEDFGIEIPDYKAKEITTVGEVVDYLCAQVLTTGEISQREQMFIRVKEVIVDQFGVDESRIMPESSFFDLGIDDVSLSMVLGAAFGIEIPEEHVMFVDDAVYYLCAHAE